MMKDCFQSNLVYHIVANCEASDFHACGYSFISIKCKCGYANKILIYCFMYKFCVQHLQL